MTKPSLRYGGGEIPSPDDVVRLHGRGVLWRVIDIDAIRGVLRLYTFKSDRLGKRNRARWDTPIASYELIERAAPSQRG